MWKYSILTPVLLAICINNAFSSSNGFSQHPQTEFRPQQQQFDLTQTSQNSHIGGTGNDRNRGTGEQVFPNNENDRHVNFGTNSNNDRAALHSVPVSKEKTFIKKTKILERKVISGIEKLSLLLSQYESKKLQTQNVVLSPISISSLLGLVLLGTRGHSSMELKKALQLNDIPDNSIHESFGNILSVMGQNKNGVNVTMNSALFLQDGSPFIRRYIDLAANWYKSKISSQKFHTNPSGAQDEINKWIERSTFGKIKELITSPFPSTTTYVAVSTIYFSGAWESPFNSAITFDGEFLTGTKVVPIQMMSQLMTVPFLTNQKDGFQMVSIPYKGGKYAMIIMSPLGEPGINSLQKLEDSLTPDKINKYIGQMKIKKVSLTIPRMKLKHKTYLKTALQHLGAVSIFNQRAADFTGLTSRTGIYIENIVHEAILEVTENGTVASAATAVSFDRSGGNDFFEMNKPSLLFIKDRSNDLTLFYAKVVEPEPIL